MYKYDIVATKKFNKDLEKAKRQNRELKPLFDVVEQLSKGEKLNQKYLDHPLKGKYQGKRECHIAPDFLLIYKIENNQLILYLCRVGTHSELF